MAIYNKRADFSPQQWSSNFQRRNSILDILYSIIRFLVIIVENLYCIPSYLVLSWLVLLPTSWLRSDLYSRLENYLYNSLLFIVSSWSLAAGLTVVESGDEFKHLIEEPEENYPDDGDQQADQCSQKSASGRRHNQYAAAASAAAMPTTKRHLDTNCRVVVNGFANNKGIAGPLQVNGHANINTRARSSNRLKSSGASKHELGANHNGFTTTSNNNNNNNNNYDGDQPSEDGVSISSDRQENNFYAAQDNEASHKSNSTAATSENGILKNNNNDISEIKKDTIMKQDKRQLGGEINTTNPKKIVTSEAAFLTSRIISERHSFKTMQAKPRILLLCNHISTADVPLIMQSFSTLTNQSILWVLDAQFKMTNFGVVCSSHGDFFVAKNSYVDGSLREHVLRYPDRNLLVLFPEGGFLRKRIEGSNRYATRNGLPHTKNVTHPRFGAFKDLTDPSVGITHIVDATLIYDDIKNPISILDIAFGNKKEPAILHYKVYKRSEITPNEEWLRNIWLEKDRLLTKYYEDKGSVLKQFADTFRVAKLDWFKVLSVHLFYLLVCYLAIFRLFNATSVTMLKARELYYSNI